jgi:hypothetical protein
MLERRATGSLIDHVSGVEDPREGLCVLYRLPEILLMVRRATLAGMEDFVEIKLCGDQRLAFLRRFFLFGRGVPFCDTFNEPINAIDPDTFKACFMA